jgi:Spy/CpxP family protein refolding chaperone
LGICEASSESLKGSTKPGQLHRLRTPFLVAALFTGVAAVGLAPALAQTAPGPANSTAAPNEARMMPGQFVDGRIAFLKAELKITPAQETQWQQVEAAMRENAKALDQTITTARQNRTSIDAVQRLELREQFAKVRADNDARLLAAFKPLYTSLSPEQQQMANQLIGARHHWHHRA